MSLILQEGFDLYVLSAVGNPTHWFLYSSIINGISGRRNSASLFPPGVAASNGTYSCQYTLDAEQTDIVVGFALYPGAGYTSMQADFFQVRSAIGANQFVVDCTVSGRIRVKASNTGAVLAESADGVLPAGAYAYIEIKFTCTGTDTVQVRVDGLDVIPSTGGLNLRQSGAGGCGIVRWGSLSVAADRIDDIYILNSTGAAPFNDFLGDFKFDGLLPTGEGSDHDWAHTAASAYQSINVVGAGYATNYIQSGTVGHRASLTITPTDMTTILVVTIRAYCRNPGGGTAKMKPYCKIGGTRYYGDEVTLPGDTCDLREYDWLTDPSAAPGTAWTEAAIEATEFGWEVTEIS